MPPKEIWLEALRNSKGKEEQKKKELYNVYGLCTLIKLTNLSILNFKKQKCPNGFNQNKKFWMIQPRPFPFFQNRKSDFEWNYDKFIQKKTGQK